MDLDYVLGCVPGDHLHTVSQTVGDHHMESRMEGEDHRIDHRMDFQDLQDLQDRGEVYRRDGCTDPLLLRIVVVGGHPRSVDGCSRTRMGIEGEAVGKACRMTGRVRNMPFFFYFVA